jgi:large subunit ribosomal protein L25
MADITLVAESGRDRGSGNSRRLRHEGRIPAVVYGHGIETTPITVEGRALRAVLSTEAGANVVVELDVDGARHLAMARDIQRHPVRGTVAHVDFLVVNRNEIVTVDVPVTLVGEPVEVRNAGGTVAHELFTLAVRCTPDRIPTAIEADISTLVIGSAIRVGDLTLPEGVATDVDPDTAVAVAHAAAAEVVEPTEEVEGAETAAGGAGAAGEPASGDGDSAGG